MQTVWDFIPRFTTQHRNHKISGFPLKHHNLSSRCAVLLTPGAGVRHSHCEPASSPAFVSLQQLCDPKSQFHELAGQQ